MPDQNKINKIKRFISDKSMSEAIKEAQLACFLRSRGNRDVYTLAAERIAIELLNLSFNELERIAQDENGENKELTQPGL